MRIRETRCHGCTECIGCGRKFEDFYYHECDRCGSLEKLYYTPDGEELCAECILNDYEEVDMEE